MADPAVARETVVPGWATEVADGPRSVILEQVTNGVAIRMAVMHLVVNSEAKN